MNWIWFWTSRLPERKGQRCEVVARGKMNSVKVRFADGFTVITSRYAVRKAPPRCSACAGVYHEATGHRWGDRTVLCGPCTRHFIAWYKAHTSRRWGGLRFYDFAFPPSAAA